METSLSTPPPVGGVAPAVFSNVRTWNILCHASALLGVFLHFPGHLLGPLIVWLAKRDDSPEIDAHGKEALNFQISMLIYNVVAAIFCLVLIGFVPLIDAALLDESDPARLLTGLQAADRCLLSAVLAGHPDIAARAAAITVVESSGSEAPQAITVRPMMACDRSTGWPPIRTSRPRPRFACG